LQCYLVMLTMHEDAILDREKTIPWVGVISLESQRDSAEGILLSDFVRDWQNDLPEDWRKHAKIDSLEVGLLFWPAYSTAF